jgi:acetyltransferase-like isoleucine patch superfamily enzyme
MGDSKISAFLRSLKFLKANLRKLNMAEQTVFRLTKNGQLSIGAGTYGSPLIYAWDEKTKIRFGKYCSIAADVKIIAGGEHRVDWITTYPFTEFSSAWTGAIGIEGHPATKGDVIVGNDVWIGNGVTILSGVGIGDGAVIAAGSVVTRSIPPYSIAGGVPAKVIRSRFSPEIIDALLNVKWWDWPIHKIQANLNSLLDTPELDQVIKWQSEELKN